MAQISIFVSGMRKVRMGQLTLFFPQSQTGFRKGRRFAKHASLIVLAERPAIKNTKSEHTTVYTAQLIKRPELIVPVLGIAFSFCHFFCADLSMSVVLKISTFVQGAAISPTNKTSRAITQAPVPSTSSPTPQDQLHTP